MVSFCPLALSFYDLIVMSNVSDLNVSLRLLALLDEEATAEFACVDLQDLHAVYHFFFHVLTDNANRRLSTEDWARLWSNFHLKLSFDTFKVRYQVIFIMEFEMVTRLPFVLLIELIQPRLNGALMNGQLAAFDLRAIGFVRDGGERDKSCRDETVLNTTSNHSNKLDI